MTKAMTAEELFDYIHMFDKILVSTGKETNGFSIVMPTTSVKPDKMNGIPCIQGSIMTRSSRRKRNGSFSMSGDSFNCEIVEKEENDHFVTVTSDKLSFPVRLELQRVSMS